jgi:hypothetical protein
MPANYVLLGQVTVGAAGAASVTLDNIPPTGYTDLKIVTSARGTVNLGSGYVDGILTFNGTTTGYSERMLYGLGGSASSAGQSSTGIKWGNWANDTSTTASTFGNSETYIPNYRSSNFKSVSVDGVQENNANGSAITALNAGLWSNTNAITSITFTPGSGSFAANSTFYLYGIADENTTPVIAPFATGGDTVTNDGTYWYHAFLSSGTFTPQKTLSCDYLVVAGGGGTGNAGGGGGAGGYRSSTSQSLTAQNYSVLIGAGGAGCLSGPSGGTGETNGVDSTFNSFTATGGGKSAGYGVDAIGTAGGSGGGGGQYNDSTTLTGGAGNTPSTSPSQGNNGGNGSFSAINTGRATGGGGGAGAVGSNAAGGSGGNGGTGSNSLSTYASATNTGVSGYYAGGGAGFGGGNAQATGGSGGGGNGGYTVNDQDQQQGTNGVANTGSGGGGSGYYRAGGSGGSGIVIVRYAMV